MLASAALRIFKNWLASCALLAAVSVPLAAWGGTQVVLLYEVDITSVSPQLVGLVSVDDTWFAELTYDTRALDQNPANVAMGDFQILEAAYSLRTPLGNEVFAGTASTGILQQESFTLMRYAEFHAASDFTGRLNNWPLNNVLAVWFSPMAGDPNELPSVPPVLGAPLSFQARFFSGVAFPTITGTIVSVRWVCPGEIDPADGEPVPDGIPDACDPCPAFTNMDLLADGNGDGVPNECQCGDADGNGFLQFADIAPMAQCAQGAECSADLSVADTNNDGVLDGDDALDLAAVVMGEIAPSDLTCPRRPDPGAAALPFQPDP